MKYKSILIIYLIIISIIFPSCSSIYDVKHESTFKVSIEVDPDEEYFTLGNHLSKQVKDGVAYKDSYIYVELQRYVKREITLAGGTTKESYKTAQRIVKVNINTGVVSSVCLDPVCNHSVDSSCPMYIKSGEVGIQGVSGDWLLFSSFHFVAELNEFIPDTYAYNMVTGELVSIFEYDISGTEINSSGGFLLSDNKLYFVKNVLDYSETGYQPGTKDVFSNYSPKTNSYLYEFDFGSKNLTELMEIPAGYRITAKTNERFFFFNSTQGVFYGEVYSCDTSGGQLTKEDVLDFATEDFIGTYAYLIDFDSKKINVYDLRTNTKSVIDIPYNYAWYKMTGQGIMISTFADDDIYDEYLASQKDKEWEAWGEEGQKIRGESTGLIYLMDLDGSNQRLIYEKDKVELRGLDFSGKCIFGYAFYYDPDNSYQPKYMENNARALINIETGEITMIPLLELIIPEDYE